MAEENDLPDGQEDAPVDVEKLDFLGRMSRYAELGRLRAQQEYEAKIIPMYTLHDEDGYKSHHEWLKDRKRMKKAMNDALDGKADWPPRRAPAAYDPMYVDVNYLHELMRDKTKDDR